MIKNNKIKVNKIVSLLILIFGMAIANFFAIFVNFNLDNKLIKNDLKGNDIYRDDDNYNFPNTAGYSPSVRGIGRDIDMALSQSLVNTSTIHISNVSNPINSTFKEACPTDINFNSTFTNITINNINAPNKKLIVEENTTSGFVCEHDVSNWIYVSFEAKGSGWIENLSFYVKKSGAGSCTVRIWLYNATQVSTDLRPDPNGALGSYIVNSETITSANYYWHNITGIHKFYNVSDTVNNTFFLRVQSTDVQSMVWNGIWDAGPITDNKNESIVLDSDGSTKILKNGQTIDLSLLIDMKPLDNTPNPEDIGMTINSLPVKINKVNGSAYWSTTNVMSSATGKLTFQLAADWWDVKCKITYVQINYTKTFLKGTSSFVILKSGFEPIWNVTDAGITEFDARLSRYKINYTIPDTWTDIEVWKGKTSKTGDITTRTLPNHLVDVTVHGASNGFYWSLLANSTNLLQTISVYIKGTSIPTTIVSFSNVIRINSTFSKRIWANNGFFNLSVYSPSAISNYLNYTLENYTFSSGKTFSLGYWKISNNVTNFGDFRLQVYWYNDTAAGFREISLTILGENETALVAAPQILSAIRGKNITYTFKYLDNVTKQPITGAKIFVRQLDAGFTWHWKENATNQGNYTIELNTTNVNVGNSPFNCNFTIMALGEAPLEINFIATVLLTQTKIVLKSWENLIARNTGYNQTIRFYFNDTINNKPILGLASTDVIVKNNDTGAIWNTGDFNWRIIDVGNNGTYILNVSTRGLDSGNYVLLMNVSLFPNYNWSIAYIPFYIRGNFSQINLINISDSGGLLKINVNNNYVSFVGNNLLLEFNITDNENGNALVTGLATSYTVTYIDISNSSINGTLTHTLYYDANTLTYKGNVGFSILSV
ncbi:MAG: hypothetical protein ACTSQS_15120, partial [Promethearchaeota archaeon]